MPLARCLPTNLGCTRLTSKIVVFSSNCTKSSARTFVHPNNGSIAEEHGHNFACLPRIGQIASKSVSSRYDIGACELVGAPITASWLKCCARRELVIPSL